jgi:hypothetical protein
VRSRVAQRSERARSAVKIDNERYFKRPRVPAIEEGRTLYDAVTEKAQIRGRFDVANLRALIDPANCLGAAAYMARSVANGTVE